MTGTTTQAKEVLTKAVFTRYSKPSDQWVTRSWDFTSSGSNTTQGINSVVIDNTYVTVNMRGSKLDNNSADANKVWMRVDVYNSSNTIVFTKTVNGKETYTGTYYADFR